MKKLCKLLALAMAIAMLFTLVAGCGSNANPDNTSAPTDQPESTATVPPDEGEDTEPTQEPESPYNFAAGKYEVGEDGLPHETFEYELPLSTTDETLTWWTTCYTPQYIPEDGFGSMEYRRKMQEMTGVNLEWVIVPSATMAENFSVLVAADDLCDLTCNAWSYFSGTKEEGLTDYFVNLYDYKDYIPNYLYWVYYHDDIDVTSKVFYTNEQILAFYVVLKDPLLTTGMFARQDWLDDFGKSVEDIVTYDDVHEMLTLFKTDKCEFPFMINTTIEPIQGATFAGYDTTAYVNPYGLPYARVIDGEVQFTLMQEDDRDLATMINSWYAEGLIDPTFHNSGDQGELQTKVTTDKTGYIHLSPGEVQDYQNNAVDPDMNLKAVKRTVKTEGQMLKYKQKPSYFSYGSSVISKNCENIELAVTFCDWWYSEAGSFYVNYGIQGEVWDYDENGEIVLTDAIVNSEIGMSWALILYAQNGLCDHGLQIYTRKYRFPGGEDILQSHYTWETEGYKGEYDWPAGIAFTSVQEDELKGYSGDIQTYISETYSCFVDGSKPLTEWDEYLATLDNMGISECLKIYQDAYDSFMVRFQ